MNASTLFHSIYKLDRYVLSQSGVHYSRIIYFRPLLIPDFRVGHRIMHFGQMTAEQLDGEPDQHRDVHHDEEIQRGLGLWGDGSWTEVPGALIQFNSEENCHQDEEKRD